MSSYITPDDFTGTDTQKVQAALNARGAIRLNRSYSITSTLTIYGNTQLLGDPNAKLVWSGSATDSILQDSSVVTSSDVNLNIMLENFEIDGGGQTSGTAAQLAIKFYRTGNVTIRGLRVHGVGGSGIRWGFSQTDTINVLVENCVVYDCRLGDAIQGTGQKIVVRNNKIGAVGGLVSNFGDTGIALLTDFEATNPAPIQYANDVEISGNTIAGNHNDNQTGIAFGPFDVGFQANIRVIGNTVIKCYLNLWAIVMDDVLIAENNFGPHSATGTGNVRIDGVTNARILNNKIDLALVGNGPDYAAILLNAQRNVYGASKFDADVSRFDVRGNSIASSVGGTGIRATFEQVNTSPSYVSRLTSGRIEGNSFAGLTTPIALAPQTGANADTCNDVVICGNRADAAANSLVAAAGNANQFVAVRLLDNPVIGTVPACSGTGSDDLIVQHKVFAKVSAPSGIPTTVLTLPSAGYFRVDVNAFAKAANSTFSATATITVNGGAVRIAEQSDGENLRLTLSGHDIKINQTAGETNDVRIAAVYS